MTVWQTVGMNDYDPEEAQLLQRYFPYGVCAHFHTHTYTHKPTELTAL